MIQGELNSWGDEGEVGLGKDELEWNFLYPNCPHIFCENIKIRIILWGKKTPQVAAIFFNLFIFRYTYLLLFFKLQIDIGAGKINN